MIWGLDGVSVVLDRARALEDVTVPAEPGRVTVIVGGDGAGKTTCCRVLAGLVPVTAGRVRRPASRVGYQPEASGAWPDLTVIENLAVVATAHRIRGRTFQSRADELLEVAGLTAARHRLASALSGGMRQKLGVAMALFPRPDLVVLDEPTTGVDPVSRADLWRVIFGAAAAGAALVVTTTYLDEAERAHTLVALGNGTVLAKGGIGDVRRSVPGRVVFADAPLDPRRSWRRSRQWRTWVPDGSLPEGAKPVDADLTDLLTPASLAREEGR